MASAALREARVAMEVAARARAEVEVTAVAIWVEVGEMAEEAVGRGKEGVVTAKEVEAMAVAAGEAARGALAASVAVAKVRVARA